MHNALSFTTALICFIAVVALLVTPRESLSQGGGTALNGYAWSDTIGWVSLNCANHGSCATNNYGLAIASDGTISGYAWSDTVGWISANGANLTGCPSGTCSARMNNFTMEGWLKALSANDAQSGAWDGFVSLSGAGYGPTLASGSYTGYGWGSDVAGWVDFSYASTTWLPACATSYVCTDTTHRQNQCPGSPVEACAVGMICSAGSCVIPPAPFTPPGGELTASPSLIAYGATVTVSWNVQEATSCSVTEDNPDTDDAWTGISGNHNSSGLTRPTTYTLVCTGPGGNLTQTATVSRRPDWREI